MLFYFKIFWLFILQGNKKTNTRHNRWLRKFKIMRGRSYFINARQIQGPTRRFFSTSDNVTLDIDMYQIIMEGVEIGFDNLCGGGQKTLVNTIIMKTIIIMIIIIIIIISNMYLWSNKITNWGLLFSTPDQTIRQDWHQDHKNNSTYINIEPFDKITYILANYFSGIFAMEKNSSLCTAKWDEKNMKLIEKKETTTPLHCMALFPGHQIHAGIIFMIKQ